jgi:hypothetical protein
MTRKTRRVLILLAVVAVATVAVVGWTIAGGVAGTASPSGSTTTATASQSPAATSATASAKATDAATTAPAASTTDAVPTGPVATGSPAGGTAGAVAVALSYADWDATGQQVEASGFVAEKVENDGTCTLTLTRGASTIAANNPGQADATTTNCGLLTVPAAQLSAGTWEATLSYQSPTSRGTSQPMTVVVPAR